jgi:hypothetical protein
MWEAFSYQVPFLAGAVITVVSLGFTLAMRIPPYMDKTADQPV